MREFGERDCAPWRFSRGISIRVITGSLRERRGLNSAPLVQAPSRRYVAAEPRFCSIGRIGAHALWLAVSVATHDVCHGDTDRAGYGESGLRGSSAIGTVSEWPGWHSSDMIRTSDVDLPSARQCVSGVRCRDEDV